MINHRAFFENNQTVYDADALAGFAHSGVTDGNIRDAINQFIFSCKRRGNWSNLIALYLLAGSTSGTQITNWKNTSAYNLTGITGITHSAAGMLADGSTNMVDTGIQVSSSGLTTGDTHLAFYTSTTATSGTTVADMGAFNGSNILEIGVYGATPNVRLWTSLISSTNFGSSTFVDTNGFYYTETNSTTASNYFKDGSSVGSSISSTAANVANITNTLRLTARINNAGTVSRRANKQYGFFSVGGKLNNPAGYATDVLALMSKFGR